MRVVDACRSQLKGLKRRFGDIDEVSCFSGGRLACKAQDGPTNRFDQLLCSSNGVLRTVVCQEMQTPSAVSDRCKILDTRHRERTWGGPCRPKDAVREQETVGFRSLHEEILLRRGRFLNQCPERIAKSIELLRVMLIYAGYIAAKPGSARPFGTTGVGARMNIRAFKCPIDLTKGNRC